jgi:hypothetical protein
MRMAIVIAALAPSLVAHADASLTGVAVEPVAECGSLRRAQLKHALVEYCEREPTADARGCHLVRRALRCETENWSSLSESEDRGEISLNVSDGCGGNWLVEFARVPHGWRVTSLNYSFGSCDP